MKEEAKRLEKEATYINALSEKTHKEIVHRIKSSVVEVEKSTLVVD